jgi:hypothetical protein
VVQVGTSWEGHWELGEQFENTMRTHGKRNKSFTLLQTTPPQPKIIWNWSSWVLCWAFSLTTWKLWFRNWLSPFFFAWAHTPTKQGE